LKDELESFKTQLLRKDSHVNSLELSLTQKNDEIEMIEEKLQRISKHQNSQSNNNLIEIENLKKQCSTYQKELQSKEIQIQQLTTELITLKELIDDFEEQKQVLKSKLEQQQIQFSQLEQQFEQTTSDFETQIKEQQKMYTDQIDFLSQTNCNLNKEIKLMEESNHNFIKTNCDEILRHQETDLNVKLENIKSLEIELNSKLEKIKALEYELESDKLILSQKDEQIKKFGDRVKELEEALRESVSITAEREYVVANQKKKAEKLEEEVFTCFSRNQDNLK
jgi:ELKS/RAB6-interacting/CAST family member 1